MKRITIVLVLCLLVSTFVISCDKEDSNDGLNDEFKIESQKFTEEFLTLLYTTTEEEVFEFSNFVVGDEETFNNYVAYLKDMYVGVLAQNVSDSLAVSRYLDLVSQYAYIHEISFSVESVELTIFNEEESDIVYEYLTNVKDSTGKITEVIGQIRVQIIDGKTLITATDLDNNRALIKTYFK